MWIGLDDTDSRSAGCTTYIAFKIAVKFSDHVNSLPRLVRLNPNLKYKTRGNGALSLSVSEKRKSPCMPIGRSEGMDISINIENSNPEPVDTAFRKEIISEVLKIVDQYYEREEANTNPGIVFTDRKFGPDIYRLALETDIPMEYIENILAKEHSEYYKIGNGRGIVGATASISWDRKKTTYELLNYKYPKAGIIDEDVKRKIGRIAESYESTFNNLDAEDGKICLFPRERTPVIYGVRALEFHELKQVQDEINSVFPEFSKNYMIFATNQGTDDHILKHKSNENFKELASYEITGYVSKMPFRRKGGHLFFKVRTGGISIDAVAFEPSKGFRKEVEKLQIGDNVRLFGSFSGGTIKIEKIEIIHPSVLYVRKTPVCHNCGSKTSNIGSMKYRCNTCKTMLEPEYIKKDEMERPMKMEPPVYARRHLSMPWKLENASFGSDEHEF